MREHLQETLQLPIDCDPLISIADNFPLCRRERLPPLRFGQLIDAWKPAYAVSYMEFIFHTHYQEEGWPAAGYEVQVNNSYDADPRKTSSLYAVEDVLSAPVAGREWFTMYIRVQDERIVIKVDGETMVDYIEPEAPERPTDMAGHMLSQGTFALQGHAPESTVYYKNVMVRPLPK